MINEQRAGPSLCCSLKTSFTFLDFCNGTHLFVLMGSDDSFLDHETLFSDSMFIYSLRAESVCVCVCVFVHVQV